LGGNGVRHIGIVSSALLCGISFMGSYDGALAPRIARGSSNHQFAIADHTGTVK
jgi:hypothetical protein